MNKFKTVLSAGLVAFVTAAWGIDEHRPIQGGTTNPSPTGPNDHTPIQAKPETTPIDSTTTTLNPVPQPRTETSKRKKTKLAPKKTETLPRDSGAAPSGSINNIGTSPTLSTTPR